MCALFFSQARVVMHIPELIQHHKDFHAQQQRLPDNNNNNIAFFPQASWGRLEMKPERNKFKVQAH